MEFFKILLLR